MAKQKVTIELPEELQHLMAREIVQILLAHNRQRKSIRSLETQLGNSLSALPYAELIAQRDEARTQGATSRVETINALLSNYFRT